MKVTMLCFTLASLSLIGIPPLGGFTAKWYLAVGALSAGSAINVVGVGMLMLSALLTAFYLLPIVADAFFPGRDFEAGTPCEAPLTMRVPIIVFAVLTAVCIAAIPITAGYSDVISSALHAQTQKVEADPNAKIYYWTAWEDQQALVDHEYELCRAIEGEGAALR